MGRIKSLAIKRTTRKLLAEHPELFLKSFEENKSVVSKIVQADKSVQNKIAGYITKLKRQGTHIKL